MTNKTPHNYQKTIKEFMFIVGITLIGYGAYMGILKSATRDGLLLALGGITFGLSGFFTKKINTKRDIWIHFSLTSLFYLIVIVVVLISKLE